ncbi:hypothetical protein ACLOJK_025504 [Asimina triloba]
METDGGNPSAKGAGFLSRRPYDPPSWASKLNPIPSHVYSLGHVIPNSPPENVLHRDNALLSGLAVAKLRTSLH